MKRLIFCIFLLCCLQLSGYSQTADSLHLTSVKEKLYQMIKTDSNYTNKVDISVSRIPVVELLKNIGKSSGLNINAALTPDKVVTCNFKQIRIVDLLLFLCKNYSLNVDTAGNILTLFPYVEKIKEPEIKVVFDPATRKVSFEFSHAKLEQVAKKFSQVCGCNLIVPQNLFNQEVSAYGNAMDLNEAVYTLAAVNSLKAKQKSNESWTLFRDDGGQNEPNTSYFNVDQLTVDSLGLITAKITNGNIQNIVHDVCQKLKVNYFLANPLSHPTNIFVEEVELDEFLKILFTGTNFTWKEENGIYILGAIDPNNKLAAVKVFHLKYRTVDKIKELIPEELKQNMEVITFPDLNSLIISGEQRKAMQITHFLKEIDKSVPLISIDVIIVDANNDYTQDMGIAMGLGEKPTVTSGGISPGIDMTLGAGSVNKLIDSFNGFGSVNLGKVTPNFYMKLKLMEENGYITMRSTPRLSTLNGNKATLKSGGKKYYKEIQTNIIGTQNPMQSESYQWKSVEANFTLDIIPFVSLDSCITLTIDLTQSEFVDQEVKEKDEAPPGTTTRSFNSIIKVRNQEMVLLGGIEKNLTSRSSTGLPFISRIPVLRWLFGSTKKTKSSQKLSVFIKPTILE